MSKKKTAGKRIAKIYARPLGERYAVLISRDIDRAIRRAQAQAWDEGLGEGIRRMCVELYVAADNPYRKAKR